MILLFSGRWDRPHLGHFVTFSRLAKKYDKIKLVLLDHEKQEYPVAYRVQLLEEMVSAFGDKFEIHVNQTHFGQIAKAELSKYAPWDVYGSGNMEVLKHIEQLGFKVVYVERAYDFEATDDRKMKKIKEVLD